MTFKETYNSIDQTQLPEKAKKYMEDFKNDSNNFKDEEAMAKMLPALNKFIDALKKSGYESAIKTPEAKKEEKPKKEKKEKVVKKTPVQKTKEEVEKAVEQPKTEKDKPKIGKLSKGYPMQLAKEIRKEGESWGDAMKRARQMINEQKQVVKKEAERQYEKLKRYISLHPEVYPKDIPTGDGSKRATNLKRDIVREAMPKGARISKKGWKNQWGESKGGRKYYEYRSNRYDTRKKYPYLADGGEIEYYQPMNFHEGDREMMKSYSKDGLYQVKGWEDESSWSGGNSTDFMRFNDLEEAKYWANALLDENSFGWYATEVYDTKDGETIYHSEGEYANGGEIDERMYNFLVEDLASLQVAINENDTEKIEQFFSYWNIHLKSLKPEMSSARMYNFLEDDLAKLESAINDNDKEEIERFFSYWDAHLSKLKYAKGGTFGAGNFAKGGSISKSTTYVPNRDVKELMVVLKGELTKLKGKDILDGVYVKNKRKSSPSTESPKEIMAVLKKAAKDSPYGAEIGFDESDIKSLLDAGFSAQDIKNIYIGYTPPSVNADTEFGNTTSGLITTSGDSQKAHIITIVENAKNGYFEIGLKYPNDFNWKPIIEKYDISREPKIIETKDDVRKNKFEIYLGKGVAIGHQYSYKYNRDKKWSEEDEYGILDSKNPSFENGYWGIVTKNIEDMYFIVDTLLKQSKGYLKDCGLFLNRLGGIGVEDVENEKFAKGGAMGGVSKKEHIKLEIVPQTNLGGKSIATKQDITSLIRAYEKSDKLDYVDKISYDFQNDMGYAIITDKSKISNFINILDAYNLQVSPYQTYSKGGSTDEVVIGDYKKNILGTLSFNLKLPNMRKSQDFSVYPVSEKSDYIDIQSATRFGKIQMTTGRGLMTQSHPNGAYAVHMHIDKLVKFTLTESQLDKLKEELAKTAGSSVGSSVIKSDNTYADKFDEGGYIAVGVDKDDYWTIISKPTTREKAEKMINFGTLPTGEYGKVVKVEEAKSHKKIVGKEYLAKGGKVDSEKVRKANEIYREHNIERKKRGIENFSSESAKLWEEGGYEDRLEKLNLNYEERNQLDPKKWYAKGGYVEEGEDYEYVNTFGIDQDDFEKLVDAYHKSPSYDQAERVESRLIFRKMREKYGESKIDEVGNYIHETHESHEHYAKGGMFGAGHFAEGGEMESKLRKRFELYSDEELQEFNGDNSETLKNWNREDAINEAVQTTLDEAYEMGDDEYADGGEVKKDKITLIFNGKEHHYPIEYIDNQVEDVELKYSMVDNPLWDYLESEFYDWLEHQSRDYEEMYFGEEAIYDVKGAIRGAIEVIDEVIYEEAPKKTTFNLDKGDVDFTTAFQ
jgi:hypothetical protein